MKIYRCDYKNDTGIHSKYFQFTDDTDIEEIAWTCKRWTDRKQLTLIDIHHHEKEKQVPAEQLAGVQGHAGRFFPTHDL